MNDPKHAEKKLQILGILHTDNPESDIQKVKFQLPEFDENKADYFP